MNTCQCSRPTPNLTCTTCLDGLRNLLLDVPELLDDLGVTKSREDVKPHTGGGGHSYGSREPINLTALNLEIQIDQTLRVFWAATVRSVYIPDPLIVVDGIIEYLDKLANYRGLHNHIAQLDTAMKEAAKVITGTANRVLLGDCTCGDQLTAGEDDHEAHCTTCGRTYNIDQHRRTRVLQALGAEDRTYRAAEAVRLINSHGLPVAAKDVENWVKHQHLIPAALDAKGRREYQLADVYELALRKAG